MDNKCSCCSKTGLPLPDHHTFIFPGNIILLGRFSSTKWKVGYGWFSYEGNRKIYGWYLTQLMNPKIVKPIQETDLYDVYIIETY